MQINSISKTDNTHYSNVFRSKEQAKENDILSNDKIKYSLIFLATLATAGIAYKKLKPKTPEPIKTSTLQDLQDSLKGEEMQKFTEEYSKFDFSKFEIFNQLDNTHQTDIFKKLFVLLKMKPERTVEIPKIISTNANENKLKNIGDLLKQEFQFSSHEMNYENTSLNNFLNELEKFSSNPNENYKTLTINNFDKFFSDIKQSGNENFKEKFENLLNQNQKNKILYIIQEPPENELSEYYKIFLKFKK